MKPTQGIDVFYTDLHRHNRPAKVTQVHHDESTLDLAVFFPDRLDFRQGIKFDSDHEPNTWNWMDSQKEQAIEEFKPPQLIPGSPEWNEIRGELKQLLEKRKQS